MSDLVARLKAVIEERLRVARGAALAWRSSNMEGYAYEAFRDASVAQHVALNDPADAILAGEWALGVLERHRPRNFDTECSRCADIDATWPCDEIAAMAKRYGVSTDG